MDTFLDGLGVVLEDEQSIRIKVMEETQRLMNATTASAAVDSSNNVIDDNHIQER